MGKKKKNQTQTGPVEAPIKESVFSEPTAAEGAAVGNQQTEVANQQTVSQTVSRTVVSQAQSQIPMDVAELIRSTLKVLIAQRRTYALASTLTSLTRAVEKALERYVKRVPKTTLREFIRSELAAMGHTIVTATIEYAGDLYNVEIVMLYRNYDELVEMIRHGRVSAMIKPLITTDGLDPAFDKRVK
jgi:hypothetical protein